MLLVDSSAWILLGVDFFEAVVDDEPFATCPPILQEILQGSTSPRDYTDLREALLRGRLLDAPMPLDRYEQAARLYLRCRDAGFTIRKPADCLIAACALAHDAAVLHNDRDFQFIAQVTSLKTRRVVA